MNMKEDHKNFECDSCEKPFSTVGNLRTHIKTIHEGQKDFKCDSCGKSFSQADSLRGHIKHTVSEHALMEKKLTGQMDRQIKKKSYSNQKQLK